MTNFSPSSSSHLLVILNEFLQLKRDSSCCPAGCMMFISSLSLSPAAQQSTRARSIFLCCLWVCQPFCRFRFPFVSLFLHFIFVFVLFVLYLYFLQFFALGFWAVRQHSLTSINCLAHTCVHNSEIAAQAILKRWVGRGGNTGRTNVLLLLGLWGWPEAALILIIKYQILLVVAPFGISVICTGSIYHMYICNYVFVCVCEPYVYNVNVVGECFFSPFFLFLFTLSSCRTFFFLFNFSLHNQSETVLSFYWTFVWRNVFLSFICICIVYIEVRMNSGNPTRCAPF